MFEEALVLLLWRRRGAVFGFFPMGQHILSLMNIYTRIVWVGEVNLIQTHSELGQGSLFDLPSPSHFPMETKECLNLI